MTKNGTSGPKARARARQKRDGNKYTVALRSGSSPGESSSSASLQSEADRSPRAFRLGDLLTECTTFPATPIEDYDDHLTFGFQSKVLGCVIPFETVLSLAGALAREGLGAELAVEAVTSRSVVVTPVDAWPERLEMSLFGGWTTPLCPIPHCSGRSIQFGSIDRCHAHLVSCDVPTLVRMAKDWGQAHRDRLDADPARLGGSRQSEILVKAAVLQGASQEVTQVLLLTLFEDEDLIEEYIWDEAEAMAMRHAIDRERLRLRGIALEEARRIRKTANGCLACGKALVFISDTPAYPPPFCSSSCASSQ
ncbi:hypothetical protein ACIQOV_03320 [Kitasatospora sp. NPDC091257]|uniref:hypothetical protein n=1 Tax=Kitasatospora sp. NPDC091257 TaxID=3364084 RepID=UPI0038296CA7